MHTCMLIYMHLRKHTCVLLTQPFVETPSLWLFFHCNWDSWRSCSEPCTYQRVPAGGRLWGRFVTSFALRLRLYPCGCCTKNAITGHACKYTTVHIFVYMHAYIYMHNAICIWIKWKHAVHANMLWSCHACPSIWVHGSTTKLVSFTAPSVFIDLHEKSGSNHFITITRPRHSALLHLSAHGLFSLPCRSVCSSHFRRPARWYASPLPLVLLLNCRSIRRLDRNNWPRNTHQPDSHLRSLCPRPLRHERDLRWKTALSL